MLPPLTKKTIALLHHIAQGKPCKATDYRISTEELRRICTLLEQKGLICHAADADVSVDADADADVCLSYTLCCPLCDISLLDVLQVTDGHLNCNVPTTEEFYSRYGKVAQKLGVVNYMTRLYLSEIKLTDF